MKKVLLIGDRSRDVFIMVEATRMSPEKPVIVVSPHSVRENAGMAGNVEANLRSLAPDIQVTTMYPEQSSVKTRYVDRGSNQHLLRVDQDFISLPLDASTFMQVLDSEKWDAVVLSDYAKGFLTPDNMQAISLLCEQKGIPVWADTKAILGEWSKSITYVKINAKEYAAQSTAGVKEPWRQCKHLIVTQGSKGMVTYSRDGREAHRTTPNKAQVTDVVGAGDTTLAALIVGYLEGLYLDDSMDFAAKAAAVAVSKVGVVAVKREEVVCP